jgi:hypothetical protein
MRTPNISSCIDPDTNTFLRRRKFSRSNANTRTISLTNTNTYLTDNVNILWSSSPKSPILFFTAVVSFATASIYDVDLTHSFIRIVDLG